MKHSTLKYTALAICSVFMATDAVGEGSHSWNRDGADCGYCLPMEISQLASMLADPVLRDVVCRLSFARYSSRRLSSALGLPEGQVWRRINTLRHWELVRMVRRDSQTTIVEPVPGKGEQVLGRWADRYCPLGDECGRPVANEQTGRERKSNQNIGVRGGASHQRGAASSGEADMLESVSAVTLATHDMRRSVEFYRSLGFEIISGGADATFTSFRVGNSYLNLLMQPNHRQWSWWGRIVFYVTDVDALYHRAVDHGLHPETVPRDAEWGERYFHIIDPDRHELSFARPLKDTKGHS
jgi:catechol 2,3-dioxygenase-like lactoylglutathione lyase family enzyme